MTVRGVGAARPSSYYVGEPRSSGPGLGAHGTSLRGKECDVAAGSHAWLEIDLAALRSNVRVLQARVGAGVELTAVIKANAYGAGIEGMVPALRAAGVHRLAVASVAEGLRVRAVDP